MENYFVFGASTGTSIGTAIRRAKLPDNEGKVIVTIAHDRGERYMNIDLFVPPPEENKGNQTQFLTLRSLYKKTRKSTHTKRSEEPRTAKNTKKYTKAHHFYKKSCFQRPF